MFAPTFVALAGVILGFATQATSALATDGLSGILTESQMLTWLSTTDAELTYVGEPIPKHGGPNKLDGGNVMVVYCADVVGDVCGGPCTVYNSGTTCLQAPGTNCLKASADVGFCNSSDCDANDGLLYATSFRTAAGASTTISATPRAPSLSLCHTSEIAYGAPRDVRGLCL